MLFNQAPADEQIMDPLSTEMVFMPQILSFVLKIFCIIIDIIIVIVMVIINNIYFLFLVNIILLIPLRVILCRLKRWYL